MQIKGEDGRYLILHIRDSIYLDQRFWRAEVRGRTVVTMTYGRHWDSGTAKKSYPTDAAADRAARADYARKLRVGFVPTPEAEFIPLLRHVLRVGYKGQGSSGHEKKVGEPSKNVVYACRVQKYWRGQLKNGKFVASRGDIGGKVATRTFPFTQSGQWTLIVDQRKYADIGRSWYQSSNKELAPIERYVKAMNKRLAKQPPAAPVALSAPEPPVPTIVTRKLPRYR